MHGARAGEVSQSIECVASGLIEAQSCVDAIVGDVIGDFVEVELGAVVNDQARHQRDSDPVWRSRKLRGMSSQAAAVISLAGDARPSSSLASRFSGVPSK